jgi:hypothetical protein
MKGHESVVRAYGAREIATGLAILASHSPEPWVWGRVAGDITDIATVARGRQQDTFSRENRLLTLAALAAVTAIDVVCAAALNAEKGGRRTAKSDYSKRSGFPRGLQAARGAARHVRDDMKTPEVLGAACPVPEVPEVQDHVRYLKSRDWGEF